MIALNYETLIRVIFNCERTYRHGADTEYYYALINCTDKYRLGIAVGTITTYLREALYEIRNRYKDNQEFHSAIKECINLLHEPSIENINNCIIKGCEALEMVGLITFTETENN